MGLFSFMSKKDKQKHAKQQPQASIDKGNISNVSKYNNLSVSPAVGNVQYKGMPDANGLYPSELFLLAIASRYKTTEKHYPEYLRGTYEINSPLDVIRKLNGQGLLEKGTAVNQLQYLKVDELKNLAEKLGVKVKGKKADIILQLSAAGEDNLSSFISERNWQLTEKGQAVLKDNRYIEFFVENHEYSLTEVGITIWDINREVFSQRKDQPYRDAIYRALNQKQFNLSINIQTDPLNSSSKILEYCNCFRIMGLFLEEEKRFSSALETFLWYLYRWINLKCSMDFLNRLRLSREMREFFDNPVESFYDDCRLYPFQSKPLERMIKEAEVDNTEIRDTMIKAFMRTEDKGIIPLEATADFLILELNGEHDKAKTLCLGYAKQAENRIR